MVHPFDRADYRDVQRLGDRIGVELSSTLLLSGIHQSYPNHRWDYALHELGHLVLDRARRALHSDPATKPNLLLPPRVDEDSPSNDGWAEFPHKRPGAAVLETCLYAYLPSEWTVQSWCLEVALRMGWLAFEETEQLLDEAPEGPAVRMFWNRSSIDPVERWSLLGRSSGEDASLDAWTIRRQHELQLQRLALYGVDFDAGILVPSRTARAQGPYVEIVDAMGSVHGRLPRTIGPEAAPFLWALWNWSSVFGGLPPGMDPYGEIQGEGWQEKARWWTETLNDALVRHSQTVRAQLRKLIAGVEHQRAVA